MTTIEYYASVAILSLLFALAIQLGRYLERIEWNKLIQQGKLPKPRNAQRIKGTPHA